MAGVLDALASYVTGMLMEMAQEEVAMLIGVSGEIDKLGNKLRDLKNFIADADRRNITDTSVQAWVEELKRAMYDVTDILDLCRLKVMEEGPSKDMGCFNPLLLCMRNPLHAHDIGTRIKNLNQKIDDICKRGRSFSFLKLEAYRDRKTTRSLATGRKTVSLMERSCVVGEKIEEHTRELVEVLTREGGGEKSDSLMVVAIVGVGGIGKTTLAKKVFNDDAMEGKFAKKIWLSITRDFNDIEILSTSITAAGGDLPSGSGDQNKSLLVIALRNAIGNDKVFLVLDDMWGVEEWDKLLMAPFSYAGRGSKVLITTRHHTVARGMKAVYPYHHVDKLESQDAWSLLKKQIITNEEMENEIDMLKDIGLQIIERCDGLPLAIKVMGGLLCRKKKSRRDWEMVLNDSIWSVSQMPEELNYAIYLSYEDLSPCLQQCLLHFSLKPKRTIINDMQFVGMWIGEGFVHGNSDRLEEQGIEYYNELILRNLIEPDSSYPGEHISNMHDIIRSFSQYMARDEALVAHTGDIDSSKLSSERFLRLSIETKGVESDKFGWRSLQEQKSLRSLILIGNCKIRSGDSLATFSSLRVLHVESAKFSELVEYLYQLKHLRYLTMEKCNDINSLPENIDKMKFLQLISLEGCENFVKFPNSIVKLRELRYLGLDEKCKASIPRGFSELTNLRTVYGFRAHMDGDWCSLEQLGPLSQLRYLGLLNLENVSDALFPIKAKLSEKVHLSVLSLCCSSRVGADGLVKEAVSEKDQGITEEVFDELRPHPCIEDIRIDGYFGRRLPRWLMSSTMTPLNCLRILMMQDLACCTQLSDGLCQLPCLESVHVIRAPAIKHVGPEFVCPSNPHYLTIQTEVTFLKLHVLYLTGIVEWGEWEWEKEVPAMPVLEELFIQGCKLRCIPPGLAFHARSLKKLTLESVNGLRSLENFPSVVELELCDIPYLTRISNFPNLQKLEIKYCPGLESLQEMCALRRIMLTGYYSQKRLPLYLSAVKPRHLLLEDCTLELLASMASGKAGSEWDKFSHIQHVEAYADDEFNYKKWHLLYTREPCSMKTNIDQQECSSEDVVSNHDENEVEHTGHELQERPDEIVPFGAFRSGEEDAEEINTNKDKGEEEIERRKEA